MYQDFSYHILSTDSAFYPSENKLRNEIFTAWHSLWTDIYSEKNSGYEFTSDEFTRQKVITAILYKEQIAAVHLYSFFHLESLADLKMKYFHFFSEDYLNYLRRRQVKTVMSMEFLTVLPEFRKSKIGFSIGSVISQLGTQLFGESHVDAIVAPARNDVGVNKMSYDLGFSCIEKNTEQRGFTCDLIACFQGSQKPSGIKSVRDCAEQLWSPKVLYDSSIELLASCEVVLQMKVS